jgi:hypothetical protein
MGETPQQEPAYREDRFSEITRKYSEAERTGETPQQILEGGVRHAAQSAGRSLNRQAKPSERSSGFER